MGNANWSIVSDMTLYIVIPPRRSIASATQILVSHMFGDAFSPYLVGALSDAFKPHLTPGHDPSYNPAPDQSLGGGESLTPEQYDVEFRALQYSLFSCCFMQCLGAFVFMVVSWYVVEDKSRAERQIHANDALLRTTEDEDVGIVVGGNGPILRPGGTTHSSGGRPEAGNGAVDILHHRGGSHSVDT